MFLTYASTFVFTIFRSGVFLTYASTYVIPIFSQSQLHRAQSESVAALFLFQQFR
jgi:hypothetical protein